MPRKPGATDKKKGSQKNETFIPGVTEGADFIQQKLGDPRGMKLDQDIAQASKKDELKF